MRNRREIYALLITAIIIVGVLIGYVLIDSGPATQEGVAPEPAEQENEVDTPEDVDDVPPSATGDIDDS